MALGNREDSGSTTEGTTTLSGDESVPEDDEARVEVLQAQSEVEMGPVTALTLLARRERPCDYVRPRALGRSAVTLSRAVSSCESGLSDI